MAWLDKIPWLREGIRVINARAITIYLWHYPLITVAALLLEHYQVQWATPSYIGWMLVVESVLVIAAVLVFGWVEDVAAKRKASLWPAAPAARVLAPAAALSEPLPAAIMINGTPLGTPVVPQARGTAQVPIRDVPVYQQYPQTQPYQQQYPPQPDRY